MALAVVERLVSMVHHGGGEGFAFHPGHAHADGDVAHVWDGTLLHAGTKPLKRSGASILVSAANNKHKLLTAKTKNQVAVELSNWSSRRGADVIMTSRNVDCRTEPARQRAQRIKATSEK
jgi:hypothetical protein